jgi:hypothetical protein
VHDAILIRHAYVLTSDQTRGIGGALMATLVGRSSDQLLVGTWATAEWAIRFYECHGFHLVSTLELEIACLAHAERFLSDNQRHRVVLMYAGNRAPQTRPLLATIARQAISGLDAPRLLSWPLLWRFVGTQFLVVERVADERAESRFDLLRLFRSVVRLSFIYTSRSKTVTYSV